VIYKDASAPLGDRVEDLLAHMTLPEKLAQMHALWLQLSEDGQHKEPHKGVRALNRFQKDVIEGTRLGIPVMSHEECLSGLMAQGATLFPSPLAMAGTWNPDLIERVGSAIGAECLLATLKHYVGHSASEGGRNHAPVHLGQRELADDFMLPFEMAVKGANAASVMPAYHDIDGEPLHASHHLLTEVLRDAWGFDGLIVADYIGITLLKTHHAIAADKGEAAAIAFKAGLDVELPANECTPHLEAALARGQITMDEIDQIVRRLLTEKFRIGLFEQPYAA